MNEISSDTAEVMGRIRRFFDAENEFCRAAPGEADIQIMLDELDPDVVIEVPNSLPHGGTWHGHAGFTELFELVPRRWQLFEVVFDSADWHPVADGRVLVEGTLRAQLTDTGQVVEMPVVSIFSFSERGVSHLVHYYQDTAAIMLSASA